MEALKDLNLVLNKPTFNMKTKNKTIDDSQVM